jgi:hypothetical protein
MKRVNPFMTKEKAILGIKKAKPSDPKTLGVIKLGKARPDKTKYVLMDFEYDEKAGKELYEIGMEMLAKNKEAVINYVIVEAIKNYIKPKCKK